MIFQGKLKIIFFDDLIFPKETFQYENALNNQWILEDVRVMIATKIFVSNKSCALHVWSECISCQSAMR